MDIKFIADPGSNWKTISDLKELAIQCMKSKVDFFKPQLYECDALYLQENNPFYSHQKRCELSYEQAQEIKQFCDEIGLSIIFSPFDLERLKWCKELNLTQIKVAARMAGNKNFLDKIKEYNMQPIISVSHQHKRLSLSEYDALFGSNNYHTLYSVSRYPASISDYKLQLIDVYEGLSDHTDSIYLSIAACARNNCKLIEKHVWYKSINSPDFATSIHTEDLRDMISICKTMTEIS